MSNWYDIVPEWVFGEKKQAVNPMQPIAYTGNGGDGIVQPRRPVEMVQSKQGPVMLHEGEGKMQNPDGSITVVPQHKLQQMEAITGMRGMADGGTYDPASQLKPISNPTPSSTDYFNQGMKAIADTASGNSPALKNMENTATQNFSGSALASSGAAKQSGAQAGYDMKAIANVEQRNARNLEGQRSTLMNTIAQAKQTAATNAQSDLVSNSLTGRAQDFGEEHYQDSKKNLDWDRMLLYYDPSTPEGLSQLQSAYTELFGTKAPDFNVLKEQRDYTKQKQQQDLTSGNLSITAQQLQNISTQLGIDVTSSQAVVQAINNGATKDYIKQKFGVDLTDDQFNSLSTEYGQKVQLGTLSVTSAQLANTAAQMGIDSAKIQNIASAINSGATKDFLSNYLGVNLTDAEYNGLRELYYQKYQIGNIQITSGDIANASALLNTDASTVKNIIEAINNGATKEFIEQNFGYVDSTGKYQKGFKITDAQYDEMVRKYNNSIDAGDLELQALKEQIKTDKFYQLSQAINFGVDLDAINSEYGTSITKEQYSKLQENTENYLRKRGIDLEEATLKGYDIETTDKDGNKTTVHIDGQIQIAAKELGLKSDTFDLQKKELFGEDVKNADGTTTHINGKYDFLTAEDKRTADAMYGYDVKNEYGKVVGRVKGSLEIAGNADWIREQELTLEQAQVKGYLDEFGNFQKGSIALNAEKQGMEVSSLYGYYYDPKTGQVITDSEEIARRGDELERVDGSLSLAAKTFGLQSKTYEDQRLEMFGGYDPGTKNYITGKMQLLSNEDQRAADQLYGKDEWVFDEKGNPVQVHRPGTLELQADEINIKNQGLSIEEAKLYGYDKLGKDGKPTGERVKGALEIESQKMDMLEDEYDKQKESAQGTALAAYFNTMKNTRNYDYENDKQAQKLLQDYWTATTGDTGKYDQEWADRQYNASTVNEVDAAIERVQASDWYKAMKPEQQKNAIETVKLAAMLSVTGGMTPKYDENGQVVGLLDEEGETVLDLNPTATKAVVKIPDGKVAGDTFIANGNKYRVNDDGETTTQVTYEDWQKSYDKAKDDSRFEELTADGTLSSQKWKESGATTIDEYLEYTKTKEKYGETTKIMTVNNGSLVGSDGKTILAKDYSTILKNGTDPNSPNYQVYQDLLNNSTKFKVTKKDAQGSNKSAPKGEIQISNATKNTLDGRPANGSVINVDGRLLYVESQGRFTGIGTDADTITLVDISTGKKQTFSGRKFDGKAGKSINNLSNWTQSLGV